MTTPVRVVQYGLGTIGQEIAKLILQRPDLALVGAIDNHPSIVGTHVSELLGAGATGVTVEASNASLDRLRPDVVVQATTSSLVAARPQLLAAVAAGASVVSTCEELAYPFESEPDTARELDAVARSNGARILGTGINPGFVMDLLPAQLARVCKVVRSVHVSRVVDTSRRRRQLQEKTGAGLTLDAFQRRAAERSIGHVGLAVSARLLARAIGWKLDHLTETIEPVVAEREVVGHAVVAKRGEIAGVHQTVTGLADGHEPLILDLWMALGMPDERDEVVIDGEPTIHNIVQGGIFGDSATAGIAVNCIRPLLSAPLGLITMLQVPLVGATGIDGLDIVSVPHPGA